jgi:hypothetical protein
MNILIGLIIGLVFFIATITAYTIGLKHGKLLSNNLTPKIELNPLKPILQAVEQKKEEAKATGELTDIMDYSRETALEAIKKGE